jgi:hypothetical protein
MSILGPSPFREALGRLLQQQVLPTNMSSVELQALDRSVRDRSFFSARNLIEEALEFQHQQIQELLNPQPAERTLKDGTIERYTAGTDQATVRLKVKQLYALIDYQPDPEKRGTIEDLSSDQRIDLVVETNRNQAQNYGYDRQGQDEAVLDEWPAYELIRAEGRREPRDWQARWRLAGEQSGRSLNDGWTMTPDGRMVALKNHPIWDRLGDPALFDDGLGNPFPPYAFGSGMEVQDVSRDAAMTLGIIDRDTQVAPRQLDFSLQPSAFSLSA